MTRKRLTTILLVTLLMMSTVSVGLTGIVAAQTDQQQEDCEIYPGSVQRLCDASAGFWSGLIGLDGQEESNPDEPQDLVDTWYGVDGEIQRIEAESSNINNSINYFERWLNQEAQTYFAQQVSNNSVDNVVDARRNTVDHVRELAADYQRQEIVQENEAYIEEMYSNVLQANNVTNGTPQDKNIYNDDGTESLAYANTTTETVELANGEFANYSLLITNDASQRPHAALTIGTGGTTTKDLVHASHPDESDLQQIRKPSGELDQHFNTVDNVASNVVGKIQTFTDNLNQSEIDSLEELNESDILTPRQIAEQYGSEGGAGWASVLSSTLTNTSYNYDGEAVLKVGGTNYTGVVGMDNSLINSLDGNSDYDAVLSENSTVDLSTHDGTLYTTLTDGSSDVKTWDSATVEVVEVTAENQTTLGFNADELESYNTTLAADYVQRYAQIRENASRYDPADDDGGIGFPDLSQGDGTIVMVLMVLGGLGVLVVLVAVALAAMRSGSGSTYNDYGGGR